MTIIVDTGPLVSFLLQEELRHRWVEERFQEVWDGSRMFPVPFRG